MTYTDENVAIENLTWSDIRNMITNHDVREIRHQGLNLCRDTCSQSKVLAV